MCGWCPSSLLSPQPHACYLTISEHQCPPGLNRDGLSSLIGSPRRLNDFLYAKGKAPDCGKGLTNVSCYFSQKDPYRESPLTSLNPFVTVTKHCEKEGLWQVDRWVGAWPLLICSEVDWPPSEKSPTHPAQRGVESLEFLLGNVFRACGTFFWRSSNIPPLRVDCIFVNSKKLLGIKGRHYIKVSSEVVQFL